MSKKKSAIRSLLFLLPLVPRKEKFRFWWVLSLAVITAIVELSLAGLVGLLAAVFGSPEVVLINSPVREFRAITGIQFGNDPRWLALTALCGVFGVIVVRNLLGIIQQRHLTAFSEAVGVSARLHFFRFYQRAPFVWLTQNGVAELGFGLNCASILAGGLGLAISIFSSCLMIVTMFGGLIAISPLPSLMFLGVLGIGGALVLKFTRRLLDRCAAAVYNIDFKSKKVSHLALHGLKEMRMYGRENSLFAAYGEQLRRGSAARLTQGTVMRLPVNLLETLGFATLVLVMIFLVAVQDAGMARISGIMGFMAAAAWRGLPVVNRLVDALSGLRAGIPYLNKTVRLFKLEKKMNSQLLSLDDEVEKVNFTQAMQLDNVTFHYPKATTPAVNNVSLTVKAGSMVGLIGLSGAGKSTLVNLMTGLLPPESGRLLVDGAEITKDNVRSWLKRIGYVAQAPYILDATLAENVALSRWGEAIDREHVLKCCDMAALDFVKDLGKGIDTVLGDRGTRLSGGQAQRVAIARALYSEPDMVIFDEATSSLDMKNEKAIHETILSLRNRVTMVIIAHRLTTVEGCDTLIWLEKGSVRLAGKPEEVLPEYTRALELEKSSTKKLKTS